MSKTRLFATAAGTVGCALAIGFFMQLGQEVPGTQPRLAPEPVEETVLRPDSDTPLALNGISLTSADSPVDLDIDLSALADSILKSAGQQAEPEIAAPADPVMPHLGCEVVASATNAALANVRLSVEAPCNRNERVTIHHTGMMFTRTTDSDGRLTATVPALSETAIFVVEFDNGKGAVATAEVPSLADYDRVVLQWTGNGGFQMHAREFGAEYGSQGHVWSGSGRASARGAVVTRLGDANTLSPSLAEIYTFPVANAPQSGTINLTIEAEVTQRNCGRDIAAQSIEMRQDRSLRTQDLVLSMPGCSAVGDFLVLNNLVDDLKIAAR